MIMVTMMLNIDYKGLSKRTVVSYYMALHSVVTVHSVVLHLYSWSFNFNFYFNFNFNSYSNFNKILFI